MEPNNLRLFLDHLRQYPAEPLLRVTFLLIPNSPAVIDSLIALQLPSLLIGLLAGSDDASSVMSLGKEGVKDSRDIAARVRLLTLHLLHAFFRDHKCLKLVDTQLFFSLLNLIEAFIYSTEPLAPQIITISTALLLASLSHSAHLIRNPSIGDNVNLLRSDSEYVTRICTLLIYSHKNPRFLEFSFCLLFQIARCASWRASVM